MIEILSGGEPVTSAEPFWSPPLQPPNPRSSPPYVWPERGLGRVQDLASGHFRPSSWLTMFSFSIPIFLLPSLAAAYTFKFTSVPTQCQELSLAIEGQGSPPYEVLIIPVGPSTAPNNVEVRKVVDQTFPNNGTTVSFPLRFPTDSQFVAIVRRSTLLSVFPSHTSPTA